MKKSNWIFSACFFVLILCAVSCASNSLKQTLPDQDAPVAESKIKSAKGTSYFLADQPLEVKRDFKNNSAYLDSDFTQQSKIKSKNADSPFMTDYPKQHLLERKKTDTSIAKQVLPGEGGEGGYHTVSNLEILQRHYHEGSSSFRMAYFQDKYSYSSSKKNFSSIYDTGKSNARLGMLHVSYDRFGKLFGMDFAITGATGIGYSTGRGIFNLGHTRSHARFNLFSFPVDLLAGFDIPIWSFAKISGRAGPSGILLLQNRNDFGDDEANKTRYQFGYGYVGEAKFQISLSRLSPSVGIDFLGEYDVTQVYLNIEGRHESYDNFKQRDLAVSGTSLGIGFSFEML